MGLIISSLVKVDHLCGKSKTTFTGKHVIISGSPLLPVIVPQRPILARWETTTSRWVALASSGRFPQEQGASGVQVRGRIGGKGSAGPGEGSGGDEEADEEEKQKEDTSYCFDDEDATTKNQDGVCLTTVRRLRQARNEVGISRPARSRDYSGEKLERDLSGARGYRGRLSPLIDSSLALFRRTSASLQLPCGRGCRAQNRQYLSPGGRKNNRQARIGVFPCPAGRDSPIMSANDGESRSRQP